MWTIGEVAGLSGVTSRTLRHYDALGLLTPSGIGPGGRRLYDRAGLNRLQQILILRELGLDLNSIGAALSGEGGDEHRIRLLKAHLERLVAESIRLERLAATVQATIDSIEKGQDMAAKDLFEGFDHTQHEAEARQRWGHEAVENGNATWRRLGDEGRAGFQQEMREVTQSLADAMAAGLDPGDDEPQHLMARHHTLVSTFWTPDAQSFAALGQMYVDDPRFRATYDGFAPGLAGYVRDAMAAFAATSLSDDPPAPQGGEGN